MLRPTGFADLAGLRVGVFGVGVEGRATARRLEGVASEIVLVDDADVGADVLVSRDGGHGALLGCDVVLKSPGIPRRRSDVLDLEAHGVAVTSALNLWLHDADRGRVIAVTGTKGKSTTTTLVAFFLTCVGERAQSLGNIGRPPYDPSVDTSGWLALEVSSFQCVDLDVAPAIVVITSLGDDHVDWHGSLEQYREDKLSLTRATGPHRSLVADTPALRDSASRLGGELTFVGADASHLASTLGLLGTHNDSNVALALAATAAVTQRSVEEIRDAVERRASEFEPLRGRLTLVATEDVVGAGVRYVDDGLATSALPAVAALATFDSEPLGLIVGGFDRGVDYAPLAAAIAARRAATLVVAMGPAGRRIADAVRRVDPSVPVREVESMADALDAARGFVATGGVVLLSPGAPSFDRYRNWEERSEHFTQVVRERIERSLGSDPNS